MTERRFWLALLGILALAAALCGRLFPTADPPWNPTVGVVWHDEGAWVHNARNRALWGMWSTDAWNPLFIAPIFTGLEYLSFALFGVGLWQARLVSELAGFLSVVLIAGGVRRIAGPAAGLIARRLRCDQLLLRDVQPRRAHGIDHGCVHGREPGMPTSALKSGHGGRRGGWMCRAGVLHQGGRRVLRRRARDRRGRLVAASAAGSACRAAAIDRGDRAAWRRGSWLPSRSWSARTGPSTASTTGRCR